MKPGSLSLVSFNYLQGISRLDKQRLAHSVVSLGVGGRVGWSVYTTN
jgi:hypothetical protein